MSWRAIQDTVGRSESLAAVSDLAERLYWRILACTDPHGRLKASPAKLRAQCYPLLTITDHQAGWAMLELEQVDRIQVYQVAGEWYLQIVDFERNQPKEAFRRRGESAFPKCEGLNSGSMPDNSRSLFKLPANRVESGSDPAQSWSMPDEKRREETRREEQKQQQHARDPEPDGSAAADLNDLLNDIELTDQALRVAAHQDPQRAAACAIAAKAKAKTNPAGLFRTLLESGDWPKLTNGHKPALTSVEVIRRMIANGAMPDRPSLDAEIAAHPDLTEDQQAELYALVPGLGFGSADDNIPFD